MMNLSDELGTRTDYEYGSVDDVGGTGKIVTRCGHDFCKPTGAK